MLELCVVMMLTTRTHVPSRTASTIEDVSISSNTLIIEEGHASYESTSVVDAIVEFGIPSDVDVHAHDISVCLN